MERVEDVNFGGTRFNAEAFFNIEPKKRRSLKRWKNAKATSADVEILEKKYGKKVK